MAGQQRRHAREGRVEVARAMAAAKGACEEPREEAGNEGGGIWGIWGSLGEFGGVWRNLLGEDILFLHSVNPLFVH